LSLLLVLILIQLLPESQRLLTATGCTLSLSRIERNVFAIQPEDRTALIATATELQGMIRSLIQAIVRQSVTDRAIARNMHTCMGCTDILSF